MPSDQGKLLTEWYPEEKWFIVILTTTRCSILLLWFTISSSAMLISRINMTSHDKDYKYLELFSVHIPSINSTSMFEYKQKKKLKHSERSSNKRIAVDTI